MEKKSLQAYKIIPIPSSAEPMFGGEGEQGGGVRGGEGFLDLD